MSEPFRLRRYTEADEAETVALWASVWQTVYPDYKAQHDALRMRWRDEIVPPACVTLATIGARIVGVITVDPGTGYVDQLAVAPDLWGAAVGAALLEEARRLSPATVHLRVNQDNSRAIRFYFKHGFFKDGETFNQRIGKAQDIMRWRPG